MISSLKTYLFEVKSIFSPISELRLHYIRIFICLFFVYKILSRDFSVFELFEKSNLSLYPKDMYPMDRAFYLFTPDFLTDLVTFHWIHWFVPIKNEAWINFAQYATVIFLILFAIVGPGPRRSFGVISISLIFYLWGFLWKNGQDIDAIFIPMQIVLLLAVSHPKNTSLLITSNYSRESKDGGVIIGSIVIIFVCYYFGSGLNKLIDVPVHRWFSYELSQEILRARVRSDLGYFVQAPKFFSFMTTVPWTDSILVPITYLSHLSMPLILVHRKWVVKASVFYISFHLMTWSIGILFFGMILMWLVFLPIDRLVFGKKFVI